MRSEHDTRAEPALRLEAGHQAARLRIARLRLDDENDLHAAILRLSRIAAETLDVERVGVWLFDAPRRNIRCEQLYERTSGEVFAGTVLRVLDFPHYFAALATMCAVPAGEAARDPLTSELRDAYLAPLGIQAMLDAPIYREGELVGVVCCESVSAVRSWSSADCEFAASIAAALARLFEESERLAAQHSVAQLEQRLVRQRQLESLGGATAAIAHDFRQVLLAISGFAQLIHDSPDAHGEVHELSTALIDASNRGRDLCTSILEFGNERACKPVILDLGAAIAAREGMLRMLVGSEIRLQLELEPHVSRVLVDETQFTRALTNLVSNARDATPPGGSIRVGVHEEPGVSAHVPASVVVEVEDTGSGMTPEVRRRMFEPFFSTKGRRGLGLGAAIVDQLVTQAGGTVDVESEVGKGTCVRMRFPRIARGS